MNLVKKTVQGVKGLLSGMGLTFGYFVRPGKVITQQYPENRASLKLPPRAQSRIELIRDPETGELRCNGCGICVRACPNNSIEVVRVRDPETKKPRLEKYEYHFERCTVCGLCVDACRSEALTMAQDFEHAVYESSQLTMLLNLPPGERRKPGGAETPQTGPDAEANKESQEAAKAETGTKADGGVQEAKATAEKPEPKETDADKEGEEAETAGQARPRNREGAGS